MTQLRVRGRCRGGPAKSMMPRCFLSRWLCEYVSKTPARTARPKGDVGNPHDRSAALRHEKPTADNVPLKASLQTIPALSSDILSSARPSTPVWGFSGLGRPPSAHTDHPSNSRFGHRASSHLCLGGAHRARTLHVKNNVLCYLSCATLQAKIVSRVLGSCWILQLD